MNTRVHFVLVLLLIAGTTGQAAEPPAAPVRTWTDAGGDFTIQARLVAFDGKMVRLLTTGGKTIDLSIDQLSAADQSFIRSISAPSAASVEVTVAKSPPELDSANWTWSKPVNLGPAINSDSRDAGPALSADELMLLFFSGRSGGQGYTDIWMSRRASVDEPFGSPVSLAATINTPVTEASPTVSDGGLTMLFCRAGKMIGRSLWMTQRTSADKPFGDPIKLGSPIGGQGRQDSPHLSDNGLTLLFSGWQPDERDPSIYMTTRSSRTAPFGKPVRLGPPAHIDSTGMQAPTLSADGQTLLCFGWRKDGHGKADLWMSTRPNVSVPFGELVNVGPSVNTIDRELDPEISADGQTLYFTSDRPGGHGDMDLWCSRRVRAPRRTGRSPSPPTITSPQGFVPLFNGKDLTGWKGLVGNPKTRAAMTPSQLAQAQARADATMHAHWKVVGGVLEFDGKGQSLCTARDYGDFEMFVDWKIKPRGDTGLYLRGSPQVQIWDPTDHPEGSGGLYNNKRNPSKPIRCADRPVGQWNTFYIKMVGERVTVKLNDVLVVDNVLLENYWQRDKPIYPTGQIELQNHGNTLWFKNIFLREIPRK